MDPIDLPRAEERRLTEEQRTETVRALLLQGFSIGDIWTMAPSLLAADPEAEPAVIIPLRPA